MKTKFIIAALLAASVAFSCNSQSTETTEEGALAPKTAKDYTPSKAEVDSVSYLVGVNFGGFLKNYDFGDLNYSQIIKGIKDMVNADVMNPSDPNFAKQFKHDPNSINTAFNAFLEKSKGVGEVALIPVMAAIANAIYDATGAEIHNIPMTRERILQSLRDKEAAKK